MSFLFSLGLEREDSLETLVTVEFKDVKAGTEVIITHQRFANVKTRNLHKQGWKGCLDNLAKRINRWEE